MSVHHLFSTNELSHPGTGLLDALEQWQDADWTSSSDVHVRERRAIEANRAAIERAKDALMRRYGVDRLQAFTLMVRWSRLTNTPVHTLVATLVDDIDEANTQPETRHRPLIRWLEGLLRHADPSAWLLSSTSDR